TVVMPLADTDPGRVAGLFALNVTAPILLAQAALPYLRARRGAIVNVSSTYGHRPLPGAAPYAATKGAVEQLTRSWALELAPDGVRVNAVAPGPTESEALAAAGLPAPVIEQIKRDEIARIPLGRRGTPEEVAAWIVHLADPAAAWLTGPAITVDGCLELSCPRRPPGARARRARPGRPPRRRSPYPAAEAHPATTAAASRRRLG